MYIRLNGLRIIHSVKTYQCSRTLEPIRARNRENQLRIPSGVLNWVSTRVVSNHHLITE